jgi:hypothetical protein
MSGSLENAIEAQNCDVNIPGFVRHLKIKGERYDKDGLGARYISVSSCKIKEYLAQTY